MVTTRTGLNKQLDIKEMFKRTSSTLEPLMKEESLECTKEKVEKRKRSEEPEIPSLSEEVSTSLKRTKALEIPTLPSTPCTNTKMPEVYTYGSVPDTQVKLVSWNVNSLNAAMKKGFLEYVQAENPDILCLQETKLNKPPKDLFKKEYKYQYWFCCQSEKKGYAGSAVLTKIEPLKVTYGVHDTDLDEEGRVMTLEFEKYYLVACYIPNAGEKLVRLNFREEWDVKMREMLDKLNAKKPVIWAGDLNVAHEEIDLARPAQNRNKTPGFTDAERSAFSQALRLKSGNLVDTFRHFHPTEPVYTYFSYRFQCRKKNLGWRLDYFVVSETLIPRVIESVPRSECYGASDHVPIVLILEK